MQAHTRFGDPPPEIAQYGDFKKHLSSKVIRESAEAVLIIKTIPDGFNSVCVFERGVRANVRACVRRHMRACAHVNSESALQGCTYYLQFLQTLSDVGGGDVDHWHDEMTEAIETAKENYRLRAAWLAFQGRLQKWYNNNIIQALVGLLIVGNFMLTATQLQLQPEEGSAQWNYFETGDLIFTLVFAVELVINLTAHWCAPFWSDGWNIFDFIVVTICLLSTVFSSLDVFKSLRLVRPFRLLRVFARLASLRMLVNAISASIMPVINALVIVMIVIAIYAVLGVTFFHEIDQENFSVFTIALFTMFQVENVFLCLTYLDGTERFDAVICTYIATY